jgi:hypothetical protein
LKKPFYSPWERTSRCCLFRLESPGSRDRSLQAKWSGGGVSGQGDRSLRTRKAFGKRFQGKSSPPLLGRATPLKKAARGLGPESPVPDPKSSVCAHRSLRSRDPESPAQTGQQPAGFRSSPIREIRLRQNG